MHGQVGVYYMKGGGLLHENFLKFFSGPKSLFTKFWSSAVRDQKSAKQCAKRIAPSKQRKGLGLRGAKGLGRWGAKAQHTRQHMHTLVHQCALRIPTLQHNTVTLRSIVQTVIPRPCIPTHTVGKHIALLHRTPHATPCAKGCVSRIVCRAVHRFFK